MRTAVAPPTEEDAVVFAPPLPNEDVLAPNVSPFFGAPPAAVVAVPQSSSPRSSSSQPLLVAGAAAVDALIVGSTRLGIGFGFAMGVVATTGAAEAKDEEDDAKEAPVVVGTVLRDAAAGAGDDTAALGGS